MNLATICKIIRKRLGITQYGLADMIGTNQTEISFIERGFIPRDENKISALCRLYENITMNGGNNNVVWYWRVYAFWGGILFGNCRTNSFIWRLTKQKRKAGNVFPGFFIFVLYPLYNIFKKSPYNIYSDIYTKQENKRKQHKRQQDIRVILYCFGIVLTDWVTVTRPISVK